MKQLLVIAIALTSVNAFATRARVNALGNSPHLVDTMSVYSKPTRIFDLGSDYVNLESGATGGVSATAQNANAEGSILRTMGDAKMGLSLGHQSADASSWGLRSNATVAGLRANQQNPIEFTYGAKSGDMNWAGTFVYSNYNNKTAGATLEKETSTGLRFGAAAGDWDATASLGLTNTANILNGNKFTGTMALSLDGGYKMDTMYFFGNLTTAGAKEETSAAVEAMKVSQQNLSLGVVNSHKKDGNELFYSVALNQMSTSKTLAPAAETKDTALMLPITIGLEVDALSWMTLRGSVSQSTLINNTKNESAPASEFAPGANSTTVAFGAGLKFNKLTFDGAVLAGGAQTINTTSLLAQAGMTYWF